MKKLQKKWKPCHNFDNLKRITEETLLLSSFFIQWAAWFCYLFHQQHALLCYAPQSREKLQYYKYNLDLQAVIEL